MKPRSKPTRLDRLRTLINEARLLVTSPDHCPSIVNKMMEPDGIEKITGDEEINSHLLAVGLNYEIREHLKGTGEDGDKSLKPQLEMWPKNQRETVKAIDRDRVFVPSRGEFVLLLPKEITKSEVIEAGEYLIAHGADSIKRGQLLKDLGKFMP